MNIKHPPNTVRNILPLLWDMINTVNKCFPVHTLSILHGAMVGVGFTLVLKTKEALMSFALPYT
jgi:hypothetical protein